MKLLQGPKGPLVLFDYTVSLLAIIGNCLVLESVLKVHFDLTGYRRFLISLAISDLYICGVNLLSFIHATVTMYSTNPQMEKCGADFLRSLQFVGYFANLLNLCGMSVDHFIGIVFPLRYCDLMNKRVTRIAVVAIWVTSFVLGFADFPIATALYLSNHHEATQNQPSDFSFPGGAGGYDWSGSLAGLSQLSLAGLTGNANDSDDMPADTMNILRQPLFAKGIDSGLADSLGAFAGSDDQMIEQTTSSSLQFMDGITLGNFGDEISGTVINDISIMIANGTVSGSGNGEENVEKTLYEEILKIVQHKKETVDWCTFYLSNKVWLEFSVMTLTLACFIFLIICYGRIFKEVFVNIDPSERNTRKLVVTTFLLLGAFTICWLPFMIFEVSMIIVLRSDTDTNNARTLAGSASFLIIHNIFNSLLMCYPLLDPVIYAARMRVVQRYILAQYGRFFPCCRSYVRRLTARRTSVFTYALTNSQLPSARPSLKSGSSPSLSGTASNTYANSRLAIHNDFSRQYSATDSAFTKRESVSALSNISAQHDGAYVNGDSPEVERPNYTIKVGNTLSNNGVSALKKSHNTNNQTAGNGHRNNNSSSAKKGRQLDDPEVDTNIQCPPLIYRNSFKRQIRQMYAQKQAQKQQLEQQKSQQHQQQQQKEPLLMSVCYEVNQGQVVSSVDAGLECDRPLMMNNFVLPPRMIAAATASGSGNRPRLKSRSSYQIPLQLADDDTTPTSSEAPASSGGLSSTTSSSAPSAGDDSSAQLLVPVGDDSDSEPSAFLTSSALLPVHQLRRAKCPCSEFANSQAVVDKFRDNSLRLLGAGTLGPDHSSLSQLSLEDNSSTAQHSQHMPSSSLDAALSRRFLGKSPTVGDFSSPADDLFPFRNNTNNLQSNDEGC